MERSGHDAIVVGAGTGGLVAAPPLARRGPDLLERHRASAAPASGAAFARIAAERARPLEPGPRPAATTTRQEGAVR